MCFNISLYFLFYVSVVIPWLLYPLYTTHFKDSLVIPKHIDSKIYQLFLNKAFSYKNDVVMEITNKKCCLSNGKCNHLRETKHPTDESYINAEQQPT